MLHTIFGLSRRSSGFAHLAGGARKYLLQLTAAAMLSSALVPASVMAVDAKTLTAVMHSGLRTLDPFLTTADITQYHGYMIYDVLLAVDKDFNIRPQMADWAKSDDGLSYTFTLRPGLKWHDGADVTAEDCVASIRRWGKRDAMGQLLMGVTESIEAIDGASFTLKLKEPADFVLDALSKPSTIVPFMMPKRVAETPVDAAIEDFTGSGPFRFAKDEFQPGIKAVYLRNEAYVPRDEPTSWASGGKVVHVDRVEWVTMPDAQTALNALTSGEVDYVEAVPMDLVPLLEADKNIKAEVSNKLGWQFAGRFNFLHKPFNDQKIRRAALLAMTQKPFLDAVIGNPEFYQVCPAIFGCGTPLESAVGGASLVNGDGREQAKALLKEAGYDGTPVVILQSTDLPLLKAQPLIAAQMLRDVGFNVEVVPMDWQTLVTRRANQKSPEEGGWNMFFTGWVTTSMMNPLLNFALNGRGTEGAWFGWPTDPEMEALRTKYSKAPDADARKDIAQKIQGRAYEQAMFVPLGQYHTVNGWRTSLTGVLEGPTPYFWGVDKSE